MLTNSLKISYTTETEFSSLIFLQSDKKHQKNTVVQIFAVFRTL